MTPIYIIRKLTAEADKQDIEMIGARLEHHGYSLVVRSNIISDVGDKWICELCNHEKDKAFSGIAPSLRTALLKVLDKANDYEEEFKKQKRAEKRDQGS